MKGILYLFCVMVIQLLMMENSNGLGRHSHHETKNYVPYGVQRKIEKEILIKTNKERKKQLISKLKNIKKEKYDSNGKFKLRSKRKNKIAETSNGNKRLNKEKGGKQNNNKVNTNKKRKIQSTSKSDHTKRRGNEKNGKLKLRNKRRNKKIKETKGVERLNKKKSGHKGKKNGKEVNSDINKGKNNNNDKRRGYKKYKLINKRKQKTKYTPQKEKKYWKKQVERTKRKIFKRKKTLIKDHHLAQNEASCNFTFMLKIIDTDKKFRDVLAKLQRMETWWKLLKSKQKAAEGYNDECGTKIFPTFCIPFNNLDRATEPQGAGGAPPPTGCTMAATGGTNCGCGPIPSTPWNIHGKLSTCTDSAAWACSTDNIIYDRIWKADKKPPCYNNKLWVSEPCQDCRCVSTCSESCASESIINKTKTCHATTEDVKTCPNIIGQNIKGNVSCNTNCTKSTARFELTQTMMDHISDVCIPQLREWTRRYTACNNLKPEGDCNKECQTNENFFECQKNKCNCEHSVVSNDRCNFEKCLYRTETSSTNTLTLEEVEKCQCGCYQQLKTPATYNAGAIFPINKVGIFASNPPTDVPNSNLDCITLAGFERLVKIRRDRCLLAGGIDAATNAKTNPSLDPPHYPTALPIRQQPPPTLGPGNGLKPAPPVPNPYAPCTGPNTRDSRNFADCRYQGREAVPWIYNCKGPYTCMTTSRFSPGRDKFLSQIKKLYEKKN